MWVILLSWKLSDKFSLIRMQLHSSFITEYDLISSICIHCSYLFDQLNLAFKSFLLNAGFLAEMHNFSSCSWRMGLVVSTDTNLDKSRSSITCFRIFFGWTFAVLISFCSILCCSFWGQPLLVQSKTLSVPWNFKRITCDTAFWNTKLLSCYLLAHILGHLHYVLISLEILL